MQRSSCRHTRAGQHGRGALMVCPSGLAGRRPTVIVVDIAADLNDEDDTGLVWTFLDEARNPAIVVPGAIVVAGDADAPAVAEVVDLVDKPTGTIVHLRLLSGIFDDYEALIHCSILPV
jgi:hypothetical protein